MDYDILLNLSAELGYRLMESGAEIYRAEESVRRLIAAYGLGSGEVFAIPNCITISVTAEDGRPLTRIRRVPAHGTDIDLLERYNALCRRLCAETPPLEEAAAKLEEIAGSPRRYGLPGLLAGHFLGAAAFCLFFGGTAADALCSGCCGLALCLCQQGLSRMGANLFLRTIACGAASAALALCFTGLGMAHHSDLIIIGALMLLVPGIAFTTALRDLMAGDTVSGLAKTAEALLIGVAIALGTGAALWVAQLIWR